MELLTIEQMKDILPPKAKNRFNDEMLQELNNIISNDELGEEFKTNILSHINIIDQGKYKLVDYFNAVRFVTNYNIHDDITKAWKITFPEKHQDALIRGLTSKVISSRASAYCRSDLPVKILKQCSIPLYIVNQKIKQESIESLYKMMKRNEDSDKVNEQRLARECAADLLQNLPEPEEATLSIKHEAGESMLNIMEQLRAESYKVAKETRGKIINGEVSAESVAGARLNLVMEHGDE